MTARLRTPDELIASLPLLLGFTPCDSVVVVGLTDTGTMAPLARVDRADCLAPEVARHLAGAIAVEFGAAHVETAFIVGFHGDGVGRGCVATGMLRDILNTHLEVLETWEVSRGRYRAIGCEDPLCCPLGGRQVPAPPAALMRALAGRTAFADARGRSRAAGGVRGDRDGTGGRRRPRAAKRRVAHVAEVHHACWKERDQDLGVWRRARLDEWRACLAAARGARTPSDDAIGALSAGLRDVVVRDAVVIDMVPGQAALAELLCADPSATGVREALSAIIGAENPVAPDRGELIALVRLSDRVTWLAGDRSVPALTLAGLALWWGGDSTAAAHAISEALARDPGYRLAELVACALEAHMPPGWLAVA